jgi:hypothetical protein
MSDALNSSSNYSQTDLWMLIRREDGAEYLLTLQASYEYADHTLQLILMDLYCSDELRSRFKEGYFLNFYVSS